MEAADRIMDDLRAVIADAEELLRATGDYAGPELKEARARAEASLQNAREHLRGAGRTLDAQVREHPWPAIGIAAGVGLIVGILLSRK